MKTLFTISLVIGAIISSMLEPMPIEQCNGENCYNFIANTEFKHEGSVNNDYKLSQSTQNNQDKKSYN